MEHATSSCLEPEIDACRACSDDTPHETLSMVDKLRLMDRRRDELQRQRNDEEHMRLTSLEEARRIMDVDPRGNQPWSARRILLEILNLPWEATQEEQRSRYRHLSRVLHPDKVACWHKESERDRKNCADAWERLDKYANPTVAREPEQARQSAPSARTTPCEVGNNPEAHPYGPDEAYVWLSKDQIWLCRLCGGKRGKQCEPGHLASDDHKKRVKSVMEGDPYWLQFSTAPNYDYTAAPAA